MGKDNNQVDFDSSAAQLDNVEKGEPIAHL
jgi:hypothetical protein